MESDQSSLRCLGRRVLRQLRSRWATPGRVGFLPEVAGAFRNITGLFKDRETCVAEWGQVCAERAPKMLLMFDEYLWRKRRTQQATISPLFILPLQSHRFPRLK